MVRLPGGRVTSVSNHCGDVVFDLSQYADIDASIANEDVVVVGAWQDFNGSGTRNNTNLQGLANENQFDLQTFDDPEARIGDFSDRGNRQATTRTRPKLITIETN